MVSLPVSNELPNTMVGMPIMNPAFMGAKGTVSVPTATSQCYNTPATISSVHQHTRKGTYKIGTIKNHYFKALLGKNYSVLACVSLLQMTLRQASTWSRTSPTEIHRATVGQARQQDL